MMGITQEIWVKLDWSNQLTAALPAGGETAYLQIGSTVLWENAGQYRAFQWQSFNQEFPRFDYDYLRRDIVAYRSDRPDDYATVVERNVPDPDDAGVTRDIRVPLWMRFYIPDDAVIENVAPVAVADVATCIAGERVKIAVLANDTDFNGDKLHVDIATAPTNGTAVENDGRIVYKPKAGFSGTDTFTYTVDDDNGGTATATVTVDVVQPVGGHDVDEMHLGIVEETKQFHKLEDTLYNGIGNIHQYARVYQHRAIDLDALQKIHDFAGEGPAALHYRGHIEDLWNEGEFAKKSFDAKTANIKKFTAGAARSLAVADAALNFAERYVETGDELDAASVAGRKLLAGMISGGIGRVVGTATTIALVGTGPFGIVAGVTLGTLVANHSEPYVDNLLRYGFNRWNDLPDGTGDRHAFPAPGQDDPFTVGSVPDFTWTFDVRTGTFTWLDAPPAAQMARINAVIGVEDDRQAGFNIVDRTEPVLTGTNDDDRIRSSYSGVVLDGREGNDRLTSGRGSDALYGDVGDDILRAGSGGDLLDGGAGADTLTGGAGKDVLFGGDGDDLVAGDADADFIRGDAGSDTITGGDGSDRLDGGAGVDRMEGGAGDDTYVIDDLGDTIVEEAADGTDTVISFCGQTYLNAFGPTVENLRLDGEAPFRYGTGNDVANVITGSAQSDGLFGKGGDDTLIGGVGVDGRGGDRLWGGDGRDVFRFVLGDSSSEHPDSIADWEAKYDMLDLPVAGTTANYVEVHVVGSIAEETLAAYIKNEVATPVTRHAYVFSTDMYQFGYVVSDFDGDGDFETVIELVGRKTAASMDFTCII